MLAAVLTTALAATWSPTQTFDAGHRQFLEPAPRAAIDAQGRSLVAFETGARRLVASVDGRRPVTVARRPLDYAVAPGAVAYEAADGVHVAVWTGRRFRDQRVATSTGSEINGLAIAADPLGGWVVAERQFPRRGRGPYRVRALSLDATGRATGAPQDLGFGEFGIDARPTQALAVLPGGRALLVFQRDRVSYGDPEPVMLAIRPHGGAFGAPAMVGDRLTGPRVTVSGDRALITATMPSVCGDGEYCAGQPRAIAVNADGTLGAPAGPSVARPNRAFAPWATGSAIVFLLKTGSQPFVREAPVRAAALSGGPLQTLTRTKATEPVALPLDGGRTLALWATRKGFGAALAGADGRFANTAAPTGPPPAVYHSNPTNRDARSAGNYAIVAWAHGRTVRVSTRRF